MTESNNGQEMLSIEVVRPLIKRARNGDKEALEELRRIFPVNGLGALMGGTLPKLIERELIANASRGDVLFQEALKEQMDQIRKEVGGENPTALERLHVERIALTWLTLHITERVFATEPSMPIQKADYYQRAISKCQGRYLAALRGLAKIRKLDLPTVQVNIGRNQVNVAGTDAAMLDPDKRGRALPCVPGLSALLPDGASNQVNQQ